MDYSIADAPPTSNTLLYSIGFSLGITMLSGISYWYYKRFKTLATPQKWRRVGTLEQVNLFPVKSCAPLKLADDVEVACEVLGLRLDSFRDRGFMIVNENYEFVTGRQYPQMVLIATKVLDATRIEFSAPNMESIVLNLAKIAEEEPVKDVHTTVWESKLDAMLCGDKYDKWFSKFILNKEEGLHLVYYPYPKPVRTIRQRMAKEPHITNEDTGTFGDATSYMLMNLASISELNTHVPRPVNCLQFRGNFQLKMDVDEPYAEDSWGWIKIGEEAVFRVVSPCTRCLFTTIDVVTGKRDPDNEPLKTLNSIRKWKKYPSPVLGIHLGLRQAGIIKNKDVVYVEDS
ncbi:mitochondrial amidoxime-reducing component 1-like isoform X1 [Teleopsis dalmanni]|uniref:mitochondrial amidoxime-reducing component 1-like isoform X1 n=1 Tax=Teleopsis dalmanni TaxID=139649 RepID=UPI0018CE0FC8|nr:mitochondrial amidoxime-reducing component 1-like isoform X1 [Teleopsis dalmanni]